MKLHYHIAWKVYVHYATQTLMIVSVPYLEVLILLRQRFICLRKAQYGVRCGCRTRKHLPPGLGRQSGRGREGQVLWPAQTRSCPPVLHGFLKK